MTIRGITVESRTVPDNRGMVITNCHDVTLEKAYMDTAGNEVKADRASTNVSVKESINAKGKKLQAKR